jgi:hypothetical protein
MIRPFLYLVEMLLFRFFTTLKVFCPVSLICFDIGRITAMIRDTAIANKIIFVTTDFNGSPLLIDRL